MKTIAKQDLITRIAADTGVKPTIVKTVLQHLLDQITVELVNNNRLELRNFGVFEPHTRKARTAQNPRTFESLNVPAKRVARFKMGRTMRQRMNANVAT